MINLEHFFTIMDTPYVFQPTDTTSIYVNYTTYVNLFLEFASKKSHVLRTVTIYYPTIDNKEIIVMATEQVCRIIRELFEDSTTVIEKISQKISQVGETEDGLRQQARYEGKDVLISIQIVGSYIRISYPKAGLFKYIH